MSCPAFFTAMPQPFCQKQQRHRSPQISLQSGAFCSSKATDSKCCVDVPDQILPRATEVRVNVNVFSAQGEQTILFNNIHSSLSEFTNRQLKSFPNNNFLRLNPGFGSDPNPLVRWTGFVCSYENQTLNSPGQQKILRMKMPRYEANRDRGLFQNT